MATKYDDIIKLRGGKAAYVIADEKRENGHRLFPMNSLIAFYEPYLNLFVAMTLIITSHFGLMVPMVLVKVTLLP